MLVLVVIGVLIIVVLGVVAFNLQTKVKKMEAVKIQQQHEFAQHKKDKRDNYNRSIQILAQGLVEKQLTTTEGAIRIGALLEFLEVSDGVKEQYSAFFQLAQASAHIPILDAWKALPTKEKLRYDSERLVLEKQYGDFVIDAAKRIIGQSF